MAILKRTKLKTLPKSSPKKIGDFPKKKSLKCGDSFKIFQKLSFDHMLFWTFFKKIDKIVND
jgi:hypothetical protein